MKRKIKKNITRNVNNTMLALKPYKYRVVLRSWRQLIRWFRLSRCERKIFRWASMTGSWTYGFTFVSASLQARMIPKHHRADQVSTAIELKYLSSVCSMVAALSEPHLLFLKARTSKPAGIGENKYRQDIRRPYSAGKWAELNCCLYMGLDRSADALKISTEV